MPITGSNAVLESIGHKLVHLIHFHWIELVLPSLFYEHSIAKIGFKKYIRQYVDSILVLPDLVATNICRDLVLYIYIRIA